jgi:hypothetical protein
MRNAPRESAETQRFDKNKKPKGAKAGFPEWQSLCRQPLAGAKFPNSPNHL